MADSAKPAEEGPVDWKAAEDFLAGKKEAAEGSTPPAEDAGAETGLVEVSIKGQKVKMTKEAADAYSAFVRETRERDGRLGGEIANLRERHAKLEGAIETLRTPARAEEGPKPPDPKLAIEDFTEYHRQMMAYNAAMMLQQQAELEAKYNKDISAREQAGQSANHAQTWVQGFYSTHPELNTPARRAIVQAVYHENAAEIDGFATDTAGAYSRLAELAKSELVNAARLSKEPEPNKPPRLEGGGTPAPAGKAKEEKFVPTSAAAWSAKKRAALRGGR